MSFFSKTLIILVITCIISVSTETCSNIEDFDDTKHIRPVALHPKTNLCYWAFDQGPCKSGKWFRFKDDVESGDSPRPGFCEKRTCPQNSEEDSTADYPRFWFQYKGQCLQTDVEFPKLCGDTTTKVYFTEDDDGPTCREDQPDEMGGRGILKKTFKRMRGF